MDRSNIGAGQHNILTNFDILTAASSSSWYIRRVVVTCTLALKKNVQM